MAKKAARGINRAAVIDANFTRYVSGLAAAGCAPPEPHETIVPGSRLTAGEFLEIFRCQLQSRHLDLQAREMRARNEGFYTIGSAGHEANAVLGFLSRETDPAFLHYRSGGFMMARLAKDPERDPVYETCLALAASSEDPVSGGRHKVWGSDRRLWVLPQTSTIASHLPKALGTAIGLEQAKRLQRPLPLPADSIVVCSFGDASANHATALAGFNAAQWAAYQRLPVPLLFVCEDNGIGISVRTPAGWIEASFARREGLDYFAADGTSPGESFEIAARAVDHCRRRRRPTFLHLRMPRLLGHAGTDWEGDYLELAAIEANEARDPLLPAALLAVESGCLAPAEVLALYEETRARVADAARRAARRPRLESAAEVVATLAPLRADEVHAEAARRPDPADRAAVFGGEARLPEAGSPRHLSLQINRALHDLMATYPEMTLFGEDVARKGGVYTVTAGLAATFRGNRVFNTLLDETTILGMAQGAAYMGLLPFPEIQYLAYLHNACDQVRGEACSLQFFSSGQWANPMVVRVAGLAYQKGFGGHFHNDNSFTALRDIPGLVVACPSRGDDAAGMLRTAAALAKVDGRVVLFLEPIALYMTKDLYTEKDGAWLFPYPPPGEFVPFGAPRAYGPEGPAALVITFGNGVRMALRAARRLGPEAEMKIRVLDLRWLKPLNAAAIVAEADRAGAVLVVDEGRRSGGIAEELFTLLDERARPGLPKARVAGEDSYIPLGPAADTVLVGEAQVEAALRALLEL
ncbi:MFS transporter [Thioalkalivibrio sp. XN8]|nr:thiamine pyrophosphate-dependent enzyme [Thioalkalivibrio sp. XN8]NGP53439.1 MFS transporter [Thioalkalivibrio sp. XN8]